MTSPDISVNLVPFEKLCTVLEKVFKHKSRKQEQDNILSNFLNEIKNEAKINDLKSPSLFPIVRLLLPKLERQRSAYNMKNAKLAALLVKVLSLSKQSADAQKLLNFKSVGNSQDSDFPGVAYFVLKNRVTNTIGTLTIGEINELLDKIASAEVGNKGPILDEVFSYAVKKLTALQLKWFLRIILKELKLGLGTDRILAALHPDAPGDYDICGDLAKVCEAVELGVQLFYAINPMLSEKLDVNKVHQLPPDKTYQVEEKFDGERFQVHMENGKFEYFSRMRHAYGSHYGQTYEAGLLTPFLKDCFGASVSSFILDGEMMGWHKLRQCLSSKGMSFDVKTITEKSAFSPCFYAFDLLFYNGKSLIGPPDKGGMPLSKRLELLDSLFTDVTGVIYHSKRQIVNHSSEILNALNKAIDDQEEGIVVKDIDSYYIANRRNAGWYKIKPEYTEGAMSDLDLVIIGADEAENKKQGRAKSFLVACTDIASPGGVPERWVCVGRVATGLTFEERERLCSQLERHWTPRKTAPPPPLLVFNKIKPDFWLLPQHSVVLQVRASELIRSTDFGAGYTLRFPRVTCIRHDKPVRDVMTIQEFNTLVANKGPVVKLSMKRINEVDVGELEVKVRRKTGTVVQVPEQFKVQTKEVEVKSNALLARKICILSDDEDCDKLQLMELVALHGGIVVANNGPDTWCSVAGRVTYRVRALIQSQDVDIISSAWLRRLPPSDTPCALSPLHMLATKYTTRIALARDYDSFGDSYTQPTDVDTLRKCFDKMDSDEPETYLTAPELLELDAMLFEDNNPYSFLRRCRIYFADTKGIDHLRAKLYGAIVCEQDSNNVTHVILSKSTDAIEIAKIKTLHSCPVVSEDWLQECISQRKLISEETFLL